MSSADLQAAIQDLRNALGDELDGNDDVRDCAFEAVAAYDRAAAALADRGAPRVAARMTLADKAAKLTLRVEHEPHGAGAGITLHTVHRGGQWLYQGAAAETHAFLDGYTEAETARRAQLARADQLPHDCKVTIQAKADFSYALVEGIEAAREQGLEYTNRERRLIGEVLNAYGRAKDAGGTPFFGRCELSHTFAEVCRFTFTPKQEGDE